MKKRDLEKLRNAFDIPDPERKKEFLASYKDKFISRKKSCKKLALPRFAPAMALAVLFVCLLGVMKPEHDLRKNVGTDNIIIETTDTSTTAIVTTTEDPPVRTATTARSSGTFSVSSTTAAVSSKPDVTVTAVVTTITETDEPTEFTENTSQTASTAKTTAATTRKSTSKTTSSTAKTNATTTTKLTTKTADILSTSTKTTSSKSDIRVTTSENGGMGSVITTTKITSVSGQDGTGIPTCDNVDYSVVPDIIYTPTDNIYETDIRNPPCGGIPDSMPPPDLVISGTIVEMIFTKMNSQPYTQFNVKIDNFIMGDDKYKKGDTISIYVKGGCMPAKEFFDLFPDKLTYDLEITADLTVFYIGELSDKYSPGKQINFELDKSGSGFPENTFIIHQK